MPLIAPLVRTDNPAGHVQGGAGDEMDEDERGGSGHSGEGSGSLITFSAEKEQLFQVRDMICMIKNI